MSRILWADDEIDLLKPYIIFLQEKGYEVLTANNGQDAIDICRTEPLDIVFLDENMPGLSGLETLETVKSLRPNLPVVMITKSEEERIMEQAIGAKIADYLIKPVNPNQILLCLKKHIHQREIVEKHTNRGYQEEFSDISFMIDTAKTIDEWMAIYKTLSHWDLELQNVDSSMREMLRMQSQQANAAFQAAEQLKAAKALAEKIEGVKLEMPVKVGGSGKETMVVLYLDARRRLLAYTCTPGTINRAPVFWREIMEQCIIHRATAIILAHNHPSGLCLPSPEDVALSRKIRDAAAASEIELLDHLLVTPTEFRSLKQENFM